MEQRISETLLVAAASLVGRDTDPSRNILGYLPTNWATGVATGVVFAIGIGQTLRVHFNGGRYMLAMVIGAYCYAIGIALRFGLRKNPDKVSLYAVQNLFATLSPCGFIAAEYVLLGRMARWLGCAHHLLVPAQRITLIFVMSDVSTFLIQGAGGGLAASGSSGGDKIFFAGLIIQLISFSIFTAVFLHFIWRVHRSESAVWNKDSHKEWIHDWRTLVAAMIFSCIGVLVRSFYRCVELSEGFHGPLTTTEWYFFVLDCIPLVCATTIYILIWPGKYFPDGLPPDYSADTLAVAEGGKNGGHGTRIVEVPSSNESYPMGRVSVPTMR